MTELRHMLKISWLPAAANDLAAIVDYIAERNPQAAHNIRQCIEGSVPPVAEHPYLYTNEPIDCRRKLVK